MVDNGAVSATLDTSTTSYTVPAGYHDGTGTVSITTQTKTVTPSATAQTVSADAGKVLSSVTVNAAAAVETETKTATPTTADQTISPSSGKYLSSVTVKGVSVPAAANILSGSSVSSNSTTLVSGSMTNKGGTTTAASGSIANSLLNVAIPANGYYNTSSKLTVDVGTATQAQVLSGKTFTSTAGVKKSGTMVDKSGTSTKATTVTSDSTYTYLNIPANGYYTTGSKIYTETPSASATLLWTNPSPSSAFSAQDVELDLSNYTGVIVESSPNIVSSSRYYYFINVGSKAMLVGVINDGSSYRRTSRDCTISSSKVTFDIAFSYYGDSAYNDCAVPTKIYGVNLNL